MEKIDISYLDQLIHQQLAGPVSPLSENIIKSLVEKLKEILTEEPNVLQVKAPVSIIGDIHGQF